MFIKNSIVTVDGKTASDEVQSVSAAPAVTVATFEAISGVSTADATLGAWSLTLTYAQDWDTVGSLAHLLHANFGKEVVLTFKPKGLAGGTWTVTCTLVPGTIGGAAGAATSTVTLPCKAKPTWAPKLP